MINKSELRSVKEGEKFFLLRLKLANYTHTHLTVPRNAEITSNLADRAMQDEEHRLLRLHFPNWQRPATKTLPGWREDSAVYLLWDGSLVGGMYICAGNEVSGQPAGWGQLHYFFADPSFKGIHSYMHLIDEAVRRARAWELEGVYIKTDRPKVARLFQYLNAVPCENSEADRTTETNSRRGKAVSPQQWLSATLRAVIRLRRNITAKFPHGR